jgi:hypothetical protein
MVQTIRHFWPEFNYWLNQVHDPRFQPFVIYDRRFLVWWGIALYLFQLGSRRQLDFELDARGTRVLDNLNRLAQTQQETRPVHKTLHYFLGRSGTASYADLRTNMVQRKQMGRIYACPLFIDPLFIDPYSRSPFIGARCPGESLHLCRSLAGKDLDAQLASVEHLHERHALNSIVGAGKGLARAGTCWVDQLKRDGASVLVDLRRVRRIALDAELSRSAVEVAD